MEDRLTGQVGFKIPLCHVSFLVAAVDQHAIPGFVLGRTRARDLLVPFLGSEEDRVGIIDDASIVKQAMVNRLPDREFCLGVHVPAPPIEAAQMSWFAPWSETDSLHKSRTLGGLVPLNRLNLAVTEDAAKQPHRPRLQIQDQTEQGRYQQESKHC